MLPVFLGPVAILLGQSTFRRRGGAELLSPSQVMDRVADAFTNRLLVLLGGRLVDVAGQLVEVGAALVGIRGVVLSGGGRGGRRGHIVGGDRRTRLQPLQTGAQFGVADAGLVGPSPDLLDEVAAVADPLGPGPQIRLACGRLLGAMPKPLRGLLAVRHWLIVKLGAGICQRRTREGPSGDRPRPGGQPKGGPLPWETYPWDDPRMRSRSTPRVKAGSQGRSAQETLRVTVRDDGPMIGLEAGRPRPDAEHGRGLVLVNALSRRWGVSRLGVGQGKAVWALLPSQPPAAS